MSKVTPWLILALILPAIIVGFWIAMIKIGYVTGRNITAEWVVKELSK